MNRRWKCYYALENLNDKNFVGIKFFKDEIKIFFPLGYQIPKDENEQRKSIIELLQTLNLVSNDYSNEDTSYFYGDNSSIPVNSYIWLIQDYLKNGLYNIQEKKFEFGQSGKINWKKTFNQKFFEQNNNLVYLDLVVEKKQSVNNIITNIHAYCLRKCINVIGWLFGEIQKPETTIVEKDAKRYVQVIDKEILSTFNDRRKLLLHHIKKVLTDSIHTDSLDNIIDIGTNKYYIAWEKMVDKVYSTELAKEYFPDSTWVIGGNPYPNSKKRPDTILTKDFIMYILDSKYYKYGVTGNTEHLPSTADVEKQITYGENIKNNYKEKFNDVYNAFILPYNKCFNKFGKNENIEYIGFAKSNWKKSEFYYENIALVLIDTRFIIESYFGNVWDSRGELIERIESVVEDVERYKNRWC